MVTGMNCSTVREKIEQSREKTRPPGVCQMAAPNPRIVVCRKLKGDPMESPFSGCFRFTGSEGELKSQADLTGKLVVQRLAVLAVYGDGARDRSI